MARANLFNCTTDHCATAPYLCQVFNHRKWKSSGIGYIVSFDWLVWNLHEVLCPDSKETN